MIRLLIFLLWVVFAAFVITVVLSPGDSVMLEAFGWRLDAPAGVAGGALALLLGATALIVSLWKDWTAMRRRSLLRAVLKRREKGIAALVEAAEAHQAADFKKAEKLSVKAAKLLDRDAVARLFKAPPEPLVEELTAAPAEIAAPVPEPEPPPSPALIPPPTEEAASPESEPAPPPDAYAPPPELADTEEALDRDVAAARRVN
jgi:uncharacterized membrane-anchored protein